MRSEEPVRICGRVCWLDAGDDACLAMGELEVRGLRIGLIPHCMSRRGLVLGGLLVCSKDIYIYIY